MIDTLATFADQVTTVAREVGVEGKLGGQAKVPGASGTWRDLVDNVNQLAGNLTTQVRAISNVATAVVAYPVLKRESEMGAIGYVAARLVEAMFIAIGIVSALAFVLMRQEATAASNPVLGHVFVSIYYRAFLVGPGFFAGLANGVILGYLMYRSELVPRGMTWLGLIGGPLVMITGVLVMFNAIPRAGALQSIAGLVEGLWELSLSIYCIVKGFRLTSPILRPDGVTTRPESDSALRHELLQPDP